MELYPTKTGEFTLFIPEMNETYHSRDGAITESQHVFISEGLERVRVQSDVNILEVGFGTGLNALVTCLYSSEHGINIHFDTTEPYPVDPALLNKLGYAEALNANEVFRSIHDAKWENDVMINQHFTIKKHHARLEDIDLKSDHYDVIYFDAFAPKKQPELWQLSVFRQLYASLSPGGVLTTYSAAGQLKRDLRTCGFSLEHPAGANGKREMTVAIKPNS